MNNRQASFDQQRFDREELLAKARLLLAEIEWTMNILRTQSAKPPKPYTDQEVLRWIEQVQKRQPEQYI